RRQLRGHVLARGRKPGARHADHGDRPPRRLPRRADGARPRRVRLRLRRRGGARGARRCRGLPEAGRRAPRRGVRRRRRREGDAPELVARARRDMAVVRTRSLGPLEVTVVGLGCNNFGGRVDEAGTRAVIDAALDAGVTFFDTADIYGGGGGSETLIGKALEGRCDGVWLATKFGKPMGDGATRRGSRDYVRGAIDASLERLRTDHVDLYQHHEEDPDTPLEETFGALAELVAEGK